MEIEYLRSSSISTWQSYCQHKYFLIYNLGLKDKENFKTIKGTICHCVLETLAGMKKSYQENRVYEFEHPAFGKYICDPKDFLKPYALTNEEVDLVNKSRINKQIYIDQIKVKHGLKRYGIELIEDLTEKCYQYYTSRSDHKWTNVDKRDCLNWVWMVLDWPNGEFDPRKCNVIHPEFPFDIEIKKDWAKLPEGGYLRIKGTIDLVIDVDDNVAECVDYKGLPVETLIPTPDGWTTMGEIKVGDKVFDQDGNIVNVIVKSEKTKKQCYKILFDDKSIAICDNEHKWVLDNGKTVEVSDLKIQDKINLTKPLKIQNKELPIDPYVLGIWLGDGRNRCGEVCGNDKFIFEEIERRGYKLGNDISSKQCPSHTIYGLTTELRKLNLLNNKHIPNIYLRSSFQQRLDLVRGLMDSDGCVNVFRKQACFVNCDRKLSENLKEILLTLGQRPYLSTQNKTGFGLTVKSYDIYFRPIGINPFLLPRKADKINKLWGPGKSHKRTIKNIELIEERETQCISVDSQTNTYLCTENMIPTHNTGAKYNWGTGKEKTYEDLMKDPQLMLYYYALRKSLPKYHTIILTIFFIRNGGPITLSFDDDILEVVENNIRKTFEEIRDCTKPAMRDRLHKDFQCNKLCGFFKNKVEGMPVCDYIGNEIEVYGIDVASKRNRVGGFEVGKYQSPGE